VIKNDIEAKNKIESKNGSPKTKFYFRKEKNYTKTIEEKNKNNFFFCDVN
jgi:hypothetical protein